MFISAQPKQEDETQYIFLQIIYKLFSFIYLLKYKNFVTHKKKHVRKVGDKNVQNKKG